MPGKSAKPTSRREGHRPDDASSDIEREASASDITTAPGEERQPERLRPNESVTDDDVE